jgi:drug/metabolite transporter (DMT)-like permease
MNNTQRAYLELHFAVFLFGFTAILGGYIQLPAIALVWWRLLVACIALMIYGRIFSKIKLLSRSLIFQLIGTGFIIALHWVSFFGSVKLANASVALVTFATTSFQASFLEPLILRQKIKGYEVILGVLIIPAMILIVGSLPSGMGLGFMVGLLSAFLAVVFSILNKKNVEKADPLSMMFLNLGGGWLLLSVLMPFYYMYYKDAHFIPSNSDWGYLLVLALLCTNLGFMLSLRSLRHLSAFASNLTINLEAVYGILLAWLILKEDKQLTPSFYIGASLIILAVLIYPFLKNRFIKKAEKI